METIYGENSSSYRLTEDDVGSRISVKVNYRDGNGTNENVTSYTTSNMRNSNASYLAHIHRAAETTSL